MFMCVYVCVCSIIYLFTIYTLFLLFLIPMFLLLFSIWFWLVQFNTIISEQSTIERCYDSIVLSLNG